MLPSEKCCNTLPHWGVKIPQGFIITVAGYTRFIRFNKLEERIQQLMEAVKADDMASLQQSGAAVRLLITRCPFPPEMIDLISDAYDHLSDQYKQLSADVAVRSSATAEDLPDASFAGQQDTYLNVKGIDQLLESVKRCFASLSPTGPSVTGSALGTTILKQASPYVYKKWCGPISELRV